MKIGRGVELEERVEVGFFVKRENAMFVTWISASM